MVVASSPACFCHCVPYPDSRPICATPLCRVSVWPGASCSRVAASLPRPGPQPRVSSSSLVGGPTSRPPPPPENPPAVTPTALVPEPSSSAVDDLILPLSGLPPVPAHLVQAIKANKFVDLADLLPENLRELQFDQAKDSKAKEESRRRRQLLPALWIGR